MDQDPDGEAADGVEGAEDVQRRGGTEAEDGLPPVQHDEGLRREETTEEVRRGGEERRRGGEEERRGYTV